jgi:hypothetical protein
MFNWTLNKATKPNRKWKFRHNFNFLIPIDIKILLNPDFIMFSLFGPSLNLIKYLRL